MRAWIEGSTSDGSDIWYQIRDAAFAYYVQWLQNSGDPTAPVQLPLNRIEVPSEAQHWIRFLTRAYSRIYKALPSALMADHLSDVRSESLTPFQKVTAVLTTALTSYAIQNLDEQTKLYI